MLTVALSKKFTVFQYSNTKLLLCRNRNVLLLKSEKRLIHEEIRKKTLETRATVRESLVTMFTNPPKYIGPSPTSELINSTADLKMSPLNSDLLKTTALNQAGFQCVPPECGTRPSACGEGTIVARPPCCAPPPTPPPRRLTTCPPHCPPDPPPGTPLKLLVALLAATGIGSLIWAIYYRKTPQKKIEEPCPPKIPPSVNEIPKHVPYLLIGGGTASFSAFRAIKSQDSTAKVLIITDETYKPYMRPPLSKELWYGLQKGPTATDYRFKQWNGAERSLFYEPDEFFCEPSQLMEQPNGGVAVVQGYHVKKVDACKQQAILSDGSFIHYDKCLIATGCTPKNVSVFSAAPDSVKEKISLYRNPDDFDKLKKVAESKDSVTIIGSGFLGSELACSLANYGKTRKLKVQQLFHEHGNMAKILPEYLSKYTTSKVQDQGVCVIPSVQVTEVLPVHNSVKLVLNNGKTILTDYVVICTGCDANTELGLSSGLEVDNKLGGFVVNAELEARKNLFVAGDAACFYDPLLGRRRVEHHDHSVISGKLAGENMVGLKKHYKHQSMFWSDLGPNLGFEGIGITDSSLNTVGVFAKPAPMPAETRFSHLDVSEDDEEDEEKRKAQKVDKPGKPPNAEDEFGRGVIFYLKEDKVVGILLWNLFNRIGLARQIIAQNRSYDDLKEVAKLFEIYS